MDIVSTDTVVQVPQGTSPNYNSNNSSFALLGLVETVRLAAEREFYLCDSLQYLFPFSHLTMYGPAGGAFQILDPRAQDSKTDFQKQNISQFTVTDTYLVRGWATADNWTGPFLRVSYAGGPDSKLYEIAGGRLGASIKVWMRVAGVATPQPINVPYNEETDRYELEIWGYTGSDLFDQLNERGKASMARGELIVRTDLVHGVYSDFSREGLDSRPMPQVAADHTMHPVNPLKVELAWADATTQFWDAKGGANYKYEFNMLLRGWNNFLKVGVSANPHGGVGFLHYRNLFSNYGDFAGSDELSRKLEPWNFDMFESKQHVRDLEPGMTVNYMDLHILKPGCGIGIHRHRDNQEVFLMMDGKGLMMTGDWNQFSNRERCFEIRTMLAGHLSLLKSGQLHSLMNATDEDISLFMFGGYD